MEKITFNYIYFRLYQFYFKWDGRNGITAVIGLAMIQSLLICDFIVIPFKILYPSSEVVRHSKALSYAGVAILLILIVYNYIKYYKSFNSFKRIWEDEPLKTRRIKGNKQDLKNFMTEIGAAISKKGGSASQAAGLQQSVTNLGRSLGKKRRDDFSRSYQ